MCEHDDRVAGRAAGVTGVTVDHTRELVADARRQPRVRPADLREPVRLLHRADVVTRGVADDGDRMSRDLPRLVRDRVLDARLRRRVECAPAAPDAHAPHDQRGRSEHEHGAEQARETLSPPSRHRRRRPELGVVLLGRLALPAELVQVAALRRMAAFGGLARRDEAGDEELQLEPEREHERQPQRHGVAPCRGREEPGDEQRHQKQTRPQHPTSVLGILRFGT